MNDKRLQSTQIVLNKDELTLRDKRGKMILLYSISQGAKVWSVYAPIDSRH